MNNDSIHGWITLARYCEISGETRAAVHTRVSDGHWQRGKHYVAPDGGAAWVNTDAIRDWIVGDTAAPVPDPAGVIARSVAELLPEAVEVVRPKATFVAYVPELLQEDEMATPLYANLTGMDMAVEGTTGLVLGPLTAVPRSARQFVTEKDCEEWCAKQTEAVYFCASVVLPYV